MKSTLWNRMWTLKIPITSGFLVNCNYCICINWKIQYVLFIMGVRWCIFDNIVRLNKQDITKRMQKQSRYILLCMWNVHSYEVTNLHNVSSFLMKAYRSCFGTAIGDQDKPWAPHKVCRTYTEQLRQWVNGHRAGLPFGVPMVRREPKDHGQARIQRGGQGARAPPVRSYDNYKI